MSTVMEKKRSTDAPARRGSKRRGPVVIDRGSGRHRAIVAACLVVVAILIAWGGTLEPFGQGQLTRAGIFAIAILGLNFTTGYVGLLSVGHSAFLGLGAYTTGVLVVNYNQTALSTIPWAMLICFVVGLFVGIPALRIRGLYLAIVTLALGVAFPEIVARLKGITGGAGGLTIPRTLLRPPEWSGFTLGEKDQWLYWLMIVSLLLVFVVLRNIIKGRYGMAMNAVRQNEIAAAASGVNIASIKIFSFAVSGAVTGMAGSLFAMYIGSLFAEGSFTVLAGITLLIGLVVGGERTMLGPIIGGLAVVFLPYYTSDIGGGQASAVLFAIVLIAVVFIAPDGVAGGLGRIIRKFVRIDARRPAGGHESDLFGSAAPATAGASGTTSTPTTGRDTRDDES